MNVPLLDLQAQYATIRDKVHAAIDEVFSSQRFVLGAHVAGLEKEIAGYCGVEHAIGVASGTDALLLSLKTLGVGPGDSVVTVPFTFFATAGAIANLGARPLFVDIEEAGFNMDPVKLSQFFTRECTFSLTTQKLVHTASNTVVKAVLPVHLFGQCADMNEIISAARRYNLPVVEDACQAIGASIGDKRAGAMGDLGCFSFFPSKNLGGAGDGGMVITSDHKLAERVRLLRTHGEHARYHHDFVGFNSRLDELQAAVLRVKLPYLDRWSQARLKNAISYGKEFEAAGLLSFLTPPPILLGRSHIFHQYVVRCQKRDELLAYLKEKNVGSAIYYPVSLHEQECFRYLGYSANDFPHSRKASHEVLALPVYPELTDEQRKYVVSTIAEFYKR
jgi:dTDP-4-amino-4,6-dideoxygalactose transaminase